MLFGLNSLCWQQRPVHAWNERSKPFLEISLDGISSGSLYKQK